MIWGEEEKEESDEEQKKNVPDEEKKENESQEEEENESQNEEESESGTQAITSFKQKILSSLQDKYHSIKEGKKEGKYKKMSEGSDDIFKNIEKINSNFKSEEIPSYLYECICLLEDVINLPKEEQKKLTKENYNYLNNMRKNHGKFLKKIGKEFEEYKKKRKNEEELKQDYEQIYEKFGKKKDKKKEEADDELDIYQLYEMDKLENKPPEERRKKWVKKKKEDEGEKKEKDKKKKDEEKDTKKAKKVKDKPEVKKKDEMKDIEKELSQVDIDKEYEQINKQRGHNKSSDEHIQRLEYLCPLATDSMRRIKLISLLNELIFDHFTNQFNNDLWNKVYNNIKILIELHDKVKNENTQANKEIENMSFSLQNHIITMMSKLEIELFKFLQFNTNSNKEYMKVIINEFDFLKLCKMTEIFFSNLKNNQGLIKIYLLVIKHVYYKSASSVKNLLKKANIKLEKDDYLQRIIIDNDVNYFTTLCNLSYQKLDDENKTKVMLYQIFYLCIIDDYQSATKLFNSSNLYELVSVFKNELLKILFNRTLAQLGICSFKNLELEEVIRYLAPLCSKGPSKLKEYLSQIYTKETDKNNLSEKEDKKRVTPQIMKMNIDDIDAIFYLASMIYDTPKILLEKIYGSDFYIENSYNSHTFDKAYYSFQKQQFNGPSQFDRDKILATTSFLMKGNWKKCLEEIKKLNLIKKYNNLQDRLFELIKRTALKCHLIFYMGEYESFDLEQLSKRFEIQKNETKNIINDMILRKQIKAKWNDNYLMIKNCDRDTIINMKKLEENVETITKQNLELMESALSLANE